jgi:hypothetical protein
VNLRNLSAPADLGSWLLALQGPQDRRRPGPADEERRRGVRVITVPDIRWGRCDIKSTSLGDKEIDIALVIDLIDVAEEKKEQAF